MSSRRIVGALVALLSTFVFVPEPASAHGWCNSSARLDLGKRVWAHGLFSCTWSESPCVMTVTVERDGLDQAQDTFIYNQCSSLARSVSLECPPLMIARYRARVEWFVGDHPLTTVYSGEPVTFICPLI